MKPTPSAERVKEYLEVEKQKITQGSCNHKIGMLRCLVAHIHSGQCGKCVNCGEWISSDQLDKYENVNRI